MLPHSERLAIEGFDEVYRVDLGGTVAFVAIHAVLRGISFGGIRIRPYHSEEAALGDALALARAMSRKVVSAGIEGGGAKAVVIAPFPDRADAMRRLGAFIESLAGRYWCGGDLGFTDDDNACLRETTGYLACGALADYTARSVHDAMGVLGDPRVVAIQGMGSVGHPLATALQEEGAQVVAADLKPVEGFNSVEPEEVYDVLCDVFSPCAAGGVLNAATIPRLRCNLVCGGANNPLAGPEDADRLQARGIAYAPDFIANAGATILGASRALGQADRVEARFKALGELLREVIDRASSEDRSPHHVAVEVADQKIAALRAS